jgi:hypothetical protein
MAASLRQKVAKLDFSQSSNAPQQQNLESGSWRSWPYATQLCCLAAKNCSSIVSNFQYPRRAQV